MIHSCICLTCGIRNDHSHPEGLCQNGHDDWLEYRDVKYKDEHFERAKRVFGLSGRELKKKFFDPEMKQIAIPENQTNPDISYNCKTMDQKPLTTNKTPESLVFTSDGHDKPDSEIHKTVDEAKAISIIQQLLAVGRPIRAAYLGLDGDWNENHCMIFDGEEYSPYESCDSSRWATPVLLVEFEDGSNEMYACWVPSFN